MPHLKHYKHLQNAVNFIEENLDQPISLTDVSKAAFKSLSYFHRVFYCMTGFSVKEYIRRRRLSKAAYQLHCTPLSITDIGLTAGYETHESFTRAFKKHYGMNPRTFRQTRQELALFEPLDILGKYATRLPLDLDFELTLDHVLYKETQVQGFQIRTTLENEQQAIDIPQFFNAIFSEKRLEKHFRLEDTPIFGVYTHMTDESDFDYAIGCRADACINPAEALVSHVMPSAHYAKFTCHRMNRIKEAWYYIYGTWFPENDSYRAPGFDFEIYHPDAVDIYIPMKQV